MTPMGASTATKRRVMKELPNEETVEPTSTATEAAAEAPHHRGRILTPVIWCILVTETAERFAYFGFRAVLVLYFKQELDYDDNQAIALFAYTTCFAYFSPLAGALLADGHWGRYSTILRFGVVYVLGLAVLTWAAWGDFELSARRFYTFAGLFLVCLGTGGIKPCVSAFGADQVGRSPSGSCDKSKDSEVLDRGDSSSSSDEMLLSDTSESRTVIHTSDPLDPRETSIAENRSEQVRRFFNMFYWCINVGAVTSIALVPIVKEHFGYDAAFFLPFCFMVTALLLFVSKRKDYVSHVPGEDGSSLSTTFRLVLWLMRSHLSSNQTIARFFPWLKPGPLSSHHHGYRNRHERVPTTENDVPENNHEPVSLENGINDSTLHQQLDDAAQALHVLPIMAMFVLFWTNYDQQSSVWTLQAKRMELNGLQPEQLNVINPIEIMLFIPLFDRVIYPSMEARRWNINPLRRMKWGMIMTAAAFFISGLIESWIQHSEKAHLDQKVNVFWQLPQITLLALGEIFLSVTGLEFAYSTSPDRLKAFLMAMFLLTTAVGDFLSGVLYSTVFTHMNRATVMHTCAVFMLGNLGLFTWVAQWYEQCDFRSLRRTSLEEEGVEFQDRQIT